MAAAAWSHDIGRPLERVGEINDHDECAANEAITLLESEDVAIAQITAIEHCLWAHSIRANSPGPETIEKIASRAATTPDVIRRYYDQPDLDEYLDRRRADTEDIDIERHLGPDDLEEDDL